MTHFKLFNDGIVICGDSTQTATHVLVKKLLDNFDKSAIIGLIIADPPYGNIVKDDWDKVITSDTVFAEWMKHWTESWSRLLPPGGAFYVWGGIGKPGFRPFFKYMSLVEESTLTNLQLSNLITWSKKRGYGVQHNYLFTREECAYFCNGDIKKPRVFNVPLLQVKRGYAGYNKKYPAKSDFKRRTNVWFDITEVMRNKKHPTEKAARVIEVPIEVHTNPGEWVIDPFAGCGTTGVAARKLGRKFILIERDLDYYNNCIETLKEKDEI